MENLLKQTVKEEIRNFMEKKQDKSMKSTISSSSKIKDGLPKAKSKKREKRMGGLLDGIYIERNMIIIRRKGVRTESKSYIN